MAIPKKLSEINSSLPRKKAPNLITKDKMGVDREGRLWYRRKAFVARGA